MIYGSVRTLPSPLMVTALRAKNNRNAFFRIYIVG